jgi:hypothetical protein
MTFRPDARIALRLLLAVATALLTASSALAEEARTDPGAQITAILLSDLTPEQMLEQLSPFVNVGDDIQRVLPRMGNGLSVCLFHGPGARSCRFGNGLLLVADPDGVVRLVAREQKTVDGRTYPTLWMTSNRLELDSYVIEFER